MMLIEAVQGLRLRSPRMRIVGTPVMLLKSGDVVKNHY